MKTAVDHFEEGLRARARGKHRRDNPYCAGSVEHREWDAGFRATAEIEDEGDLTDPCSQAHHAL